MAQIGIYGTGGFAREVAWLVSEIEGLTDKRTELIAYIDDTVSGVIGNVPVLQLEQFTASYPEALIAIAIGDPTTREKVALRCGEARFASLIAGSAQHSSSVSFGEGCIVCAGSILTVDITLGRHVHVNLGCTIGHDVVIEDYVTLSPGVHVSGNVRIERGVYIGTGASIINGIPGKPLMIGAHAVIGAGACVTGDVEPKCLYAGVPAILKKRY